MERWKFKHPMTARFVGPTSCGKTTFLSRVIQQKLIDPWPSKILYLYGSAWQSPVFDTLKSEHGVVFQKGFDEGVIESHAGHSSLLIVCDDLVLEMKDSESAANLFMRGSHHLNMSVILIEQTLFPKGKSSVSLKQNTAYTVIFKSPTDALGVATLSRQMFPQRNGRFMTDSFHDCTQNPFSYIIIDSKQETPDELRLLTRIDDPNTHPIVYMPAADSHDRIESFNRKSMTVGHEEKV